MKKGRVILIFVIMIIMGAAVIGRLIDIQIIKGDLYKALASGQQKDFKPITGERGDIFFKDGEILATNMNAKYLFVSPNSINEKEKIANSLSEIFQLDQEEILKKLKKDSSFERIDVNLTEEKEEVLKQANLNGVYLGKASFRKYPQGEIASQVIGFLGGENKGQYGIEGYYDDILRGKEKFQQTNSVNSFFSRKSVKGADIFLTLDYNIQFTAEKLLEKAKEDWDIEEGQIIVIEPDTGKILAMANFPNFDPNNYSEVEDFHIFQNSAIQKVFEPGSIFKAITMAIALDQGKVTPQTLYVDTGKVEIGRYFIANYNNHVFGEQTMTQVLEKSINTGAVFAERELGHELFLKYLDKLAFFEPTGIDLQEEIFSENKEFKNGYEINFATASFGQGIEMTPMQFARAFCVIANGGKLIKPYIVEKIVQNDRVIKAPAINGLDGDSQEEDVQQFAPQIISKKSASQLTAMLVSVIENGQYTTRAKIPGYYVAGKTGTSQVSWSSLGESKKGYSDKTWQSFAGFVPAFSPKFVILVKLNNPTTKVAVYSATPIFQELAKYILDYQEIPSNRDEL
ncbi:MAG: penicillin-binding protein 2 [Patescibacteria group bacterium]|nr:penicillin-binding protein 2 [Patescibacteria group bacterium]